MTWPPDRNKHHGRIVAALYRQAVSVPCERQVVLAGGLRGSDKDGALAKAGIHRSRYLTISVDAILAELARRSLIPVVAGRLPLEAADLVHAQAQDIAGRLAARALADGRNVLLDTTMASEASVKSWLRVMDLAACHLDVVIAEISPDEAVRWSAAAHRAANERHRRGIGQGGRDVPAEAIRATEPGLAAVAATDWATVIAYLSRRRPVQFPESETIGLIRQYQAGRVTLDGLVRQVRQRPWAPALPVCPPSLAAAQLAIDDPKPWIPGSLDELVLGYDLGLLGDEEYAVLVRALD
jgi:predicted kinase